ncbi:hypothetical protein BH18ACT17_BH18ACT17_00420 [soil metagenome]
MTRAATVRLVARKKQAAISDADKSAIGALLRELRRSAGYRSAQAAAGAAACPASRQTIYSYERGGLVPSLAQFLELVEFYVLGPAPTPASAGDRKAESDLRTLGVAAVARALTLPAYHVSQANELMARMQPRLGQGRDGRDRGGREGGG